MHIEFEAEAELALRAVSTAAELLSDRPETFSTKGSARDVVTEIDHRVEQQLFATLAGQVHHVVGEEDMASHAAYTANAPCWFVDPIDGTANFMAGIPFYGVSVGLLRGETPLVGAVSIPALKELFFTHGTRAAYLNGRLLQCQDAAMHDSLIAASLSSKVGSKQYAVFGRANDISRGCLRTGSAALNLCYVAASRLQAAYGFDAALWDVAAGLAIAKAAGCTVHLRINGLRATYAVGAPTTVARILELFAEEGL